MPAESRRKKDGQEPQHPHEAAWRLRGYEIVEPELTYLGCPFGDDPVERSAIQSAVDRARAARRPVQPPESGLRGRLPRSRYLRSYASQENRGRSRRNAADRRFPSAPEQRAPQSEEPADSRRRDDDWATDWAMNPLLARCAQPSVKSQDVV
jgi:hypothetical protein